MSTEIVKTTTAIPCKTVYRGISFGYQLQPMEVKQVSEEEDGLLARLEEYFSQASFTESIHGWMQSHGKAVEFLPLDEEQPLQNMNLFQNYAEMIAGQLDEFVRREATTGEALVDALRRSQDAGNLSLACLDFILASVDYEDFIGLVSDFCVASDWTEVTGETSADLEADDKMLAPP